MLCAGAAFGLVSVRVVFLAGSAADGAHPGLTAAAWELCERGTASLSRGEFHRRLEHTGAEWSMHVSRRSVILDVRVLQEELPRALALVAEALVDPADDADELESLLDEIDERQLCDLEDPGSLVSRGVPVALWEGTAWETPAEGTARTRRTLTRSLIRTHRPTILGSQLIVGIAAEDPGEVLPSVRAFIETFRAAGTEPLPFSARPEPAWGTTHLYPFDADQGAVTVLAEAPRAKGELWAAAALHSTFFGEGFRSPLIDAMRSRDGLSYEIGWHLIPELESGVHVFRAFPESGNITRALDVVGECWKEWAAQEIPAEALARAKSAFIGSRLIALETVERRMTTAVRARRLGLPVTRLWELPGRVAELNAGEVAGAAASFGWATGRRVTVAAARGGAAASQWADSELGPVEREPEALL